MESVQTGIIKTREHSLRAEQNLSRCSRSATRINIYKQNIPEKFAEKKKYKHMKYKKK